MWNTYDSDGHYQAMCFQISSKYHWKCCGNNASDDDSKIVIPREPSSYSFVVTGTFSVIGMVGVATAFVVLIRSRRRVPLASQDDTVLQLA